MLYYLSKCQVSKFSYRSYPGSPDKFLVGFLVFLGQGGSFSRREEVYEMVGRIVYVGAVIAFSQVGLCTQTMQDCGQQAATDLHKVEMSSKTEQQFRPISNGHIC